MGHVIEEITPVTDKQIIMALLLLCMLAVARYIIHRIVVIYNKSLSGRLSRVGISMVMNDYEGLSISLPESALKKCRTDMIVLKMGEFTTGRDYDEDIKIKVGRNSVFIPFEDEIELTLPCFFTT